MEHEFLPERAVRPSPRPRHDGAGPDPGGAGPRPAGAGNAAFTRLLRGPVQRQAAAGGVVELGPEQVRSSRRDRSEYVQRRTVAVGAVMGQVDRYVAAVQQGHRQGLANYAQWYRSYAKAKEDASTQLAAKVCGFLLDKGLDLVFPEAGVLQEVLKQIASMAFEQARDRVGEVGAGDVEGYLASLAQVEEGAITRLLDAHDAFLREHGDVVDEAVIAFLVAQDDGWAPDRDGELPPAVLALLRKAGVGVHGAGLATTFAERWLTSHIRATFEQDPGVMQGRGGMATEVLARIAALRKLDAVGNRERVFALEAGLPAFFRTVADLNADGAAVLRLRLGLDAAQAEQIVTSRAAGGRFADPRELVARGLLDQDGYRRVEAHVVAR